MPAAVLALALALASVDVPRLESARAQLEHGLAARAELRGLSGRACARARSRAVAALRAVRSFWPEARASGAEAAFRAGELLRAGGRPDEALVEFELARELGAGTPFRSRAALEVGHVHRRAGRLEQALDAYFAVLTDAVTRSEYRDDAGLWAGRAFHDLGRAREGRRIWEHVALTAVDPLDRIRAHDYLALELVERGDLEGAAGALHRCRTALADVAEEETELGIRVRKALVHMRALQHLRSAIERRRERARRRARLVRRNPPQCARDLGRTLYSQP